MTLLEYHRVQLEERAGWNPAEMEAEVRAQDSNFPERVRSLLFSADSPTAMAQGSPAFDHARELCQLWLNATAPQRAFVRAQIDSSSARWLSRFRAEAKRLALNQQPEFWLRLALASLAIDDLHRDARDAILSVYNLLAASRKTGAPWGELVRGVAELSGPAMAALFGDCLRNHPA